METATTVPALSASLQSIPVDQLRPNPWNRTVFDPEAMKDLVASLKAVGIKEPLIVRPLPEGGYQIASGHRRWLAAKEAGLSEVPCLVEALTDEQVAEDNITINLQREDLPPLEMARMVKGYMDQFKKTQDQAADQFGKSRPWVTQLLGFLNLDPEVLSNVTAVTLGVRPLRALTMLPKDKQMQVVRELHAGKLKPEGVEKRCNQLRFSGAAKSPAAKALAGGTQPLSDDPLSEFWRPLQIRAMATGKKWGVSYSPQPLYKGVSIPAWHFWFPNTGLVPRADLKRWFLEMAESMGDAEGEEKQTLADLGQKISTSTAQPPSDEVSEEEIQKLLAMGRIG